MIQDVIKRIDEIAENEPDRVVYDYLGETNTYGDLRSVQTLGHTRLLVWISQNMHQS